MNVANLIIQCLIAEGVQYVFGVPGEETEALQFALEESEEITFIPTRHEQGAAFMADVWGRLTGKAGVCLSTLGPGATNLLTGVADANLDKAPLVALTGQGSTERLHHESHQLIDVVQLFQPVTKWNTSLREPATTVEVMRKAFKLAQAEKPGATHVEIPENIADFVFENEPTPLDPKTVNQPFPHEASLGDAIRLIANATRPIILVGNGVIRNDCGERLTRLVKFTNFPVVHTFMGKGAVSDRLEQSLFSVGLGFKDYVLEAFEQADVVLTIGYDIAEYAPDNWNIGRDKKIVHMDFNPAEVYEHYQPEVEVIGNIASSIEDLYRQLAMGEKYRDQEIWYSDIRERIQASISKFDLAPKDDFQVPGVINLVRQHLPDDGLLISDVGSHKMWIARNYPTYCPNGCLISNGFASMGFALPSAISASLQNPKRPVVAICGDGGFMMNVQELETAARLGNPFTLIVCNDNDYGLIRWKQEQHRQNSAGTALQNPDFVQLAKSFGINGHRPESVKDLDELLADCLTNDQIDVIEIPVTTEVNGQLTEMLKEYFD